MTEQHLSEPEVFSDKKLVREIKRKILVLGEGGVGKTTLIYRYVNDDFMDSTKMTIGSDFFVKKLQLEDGLYDNQLTLLFWDFAGQKRFRFILKDYIKGADCVLLLFDLTRYMSLVLLNNWIDFLQDGGIWGDPDVKFFLVGTKKDSIGNGHSKIPHEFIRQFQEKFSVRRYFETSAKDGQGIATLFEDVARSLL